jgi:drug/metabolite transporter (DMT)-like permease
LRNPHLLLTLSTLFWAGNWIVGRALVDLMPPAALTFWRWIIALLLMAPFVVPRLLAQRSLLRRHWKIIVVLGLLGGGLHNILQYWGLHYTGAANGAILTALMPVYVMLAGAAFLKEPLSRRAAVGAAISILGVVAIVFRLDLDAVRAFSLNPGDLLIILSHFMLAAYTLGLRRRPAGLDPLSFLACFALVALPPVGIAYLGELASGARIVWTPTAVAGLAFVAVFPALLAYHFWNLGVAALGPARSAVFFYLTPLFGSLLAVALLGERLGWHHAIGGALIIVGVSLASRAGLPRG